MSRNQIHLLVRWSLVFLTAFVVLLSASQARPALLAERLLELVVYAVLTAFALIFSSPLSKGEQSVAHVVGMMAFLSLPADLAPLMTLAIFMGGLVGSSILAQGERLSYQPKARGFDVSTMLYLTATVTLAFFAASRIYSDIFLGRLPLHGTDVFANVLPLVVYVTVYILLYVLGFILKIEDRSQNTRATVRENIITLTVVLLLPVPFALIGASVAQKDESLLLFSITVIGASLTIFGLYVLSYSQQSLQRRLDEMRSISGLALALQDKMRVHELLRAVYLQIRQFLDLPYFMVVLRKDDGRLSYPLVIQKYQESPTSPNLPPVDALLIDYVLKSGKALLLSAEETSQAQGLTLPHSIAAWLGVPLLVGDKTIGAFILLADDYPRFSQDDVRLMTVIAASVSIAIENTRLYEQQSLRAEQLATLNQVTALLTGTLSPMEVLDIIVSSASTISDANAVAVFLLADDETGDLQLVRSAGFQHHDNLLIPQPFLAEQLRHSADHYLQPQAYIIPNIEQAQAYELQVLKSLSTQEEKKALIEIPLIIGGNYQGILVLYYDEAQVFSDEHIDIVQAFGTQAAQAIDNARTFATTDKALEQRVEQLYALAAMGRLLNAAMDTQKIYDVVLTYATDATKAPRGAVVILEGDNLLVPAQRGYEENTFVNVDSLRQGLFARAFTGQAIHSNDVRLETDYIPLHPQNRSLLITPIMKGRSTLGMIILESGRVGAFSEGDSHFVAQIANQAVIAIDNTSLFQRIREARDNLQVILNAMVEGLLLIDRQGLITLANPRVDLLGLESADLLNHTVTSLVEDSDLRLAKKLGFSSDEALLRLLDYLHSGNNTSSYADQIYEIVSESTGRHYIERQIIPIRDDKQTIVGLLLVFYNKTEEYELENAREAFSQMTVHDLRSPLTAVTMSLRLLQELIPASSEFRPLVDKTTDASSRAIRKVLTRVNSLLDISKMESGELSLERELVNLASIVENVRTELRPLSEGLEVSVISEVDTKLPLLDVDVDKIERVVLNLVDNALKYSPPNSRVLIQARTNENGSVILAVSDQGPGVPDDYKTRLFERYAQIEGRKAVRQGVGLGLTFCKLVIEAHGGTIWIEDNPTGGSIFKASLPVAKLADTSDNKAINTLK